MAEAPPPLAARQGGGGRPGAPGAHTDVAQALFSAVQKNEVALALQLVDAGADPNSVDAWGETPLFEAAAAGHGEVLRGLLLRSADPGRVSFSGHTARDLAVDAATRALLGQPPGGGCAGEGPLLRAVRASDLPAVLQLLEQGADPNRPDATGETALFEAAAVGDLDVCAALLLRRADPTARSRAGLAASDLAASVQVLSLLGAFSGGGAEGGAGQAALAALDAPMRQQVAAWLGAGAARGVPRPKASAAGAAREPPRAPAAPARTLLEAVQSGDLGLVLRALGAGADPNEADELGETPLFEAVTAGDADLTAALLLHRADPARRSTSGMAVEDVAANDGVRSLLRLFAGAEMGAASKAAALESLSDPVREMVAAATKIQIGAVAEGPAPTQEAEAEAGQRGQAEQTAPLAGGPARQAAFEEAPRGDGRARKALQEGAPAEQADPEAPSRRRGGEQRGPQERAPAGQAGLGEAPPAGAPPNGGPAPPSAPDELARAHGEQGTPPAVAAAQVLEESAGAAEADANVERRALPAAAAAATAAQQVLEESPRAADAEANAERRAPQAAAAAAQQALEESPGDSEADANPERRAPQAAAATAAQQVLEESPGAADAEANAERSAPQAAAAAAAAQQVLEESPRAADAEANAELSAPQAAETAAAQQVLEEFAGAADAEANAKRSAPQAAAAAQQVLEESPRDAGAVVCGAREAAGPLGTGVRPSACDELRAHEGQGASQAAAAAQVVEEAGACGTQEAPGLGAVLRAQLQPEQRGGLRGPPPQEREPSSKARAASGGERPGAEQFALGAGSAGARPASRSGSEGHEASPRAGGSASPSAPGEERAAAPPAEAGAPLAAAARAGAVDDVVRLLREGADPNATDAVGETPLFGAAACGSASAVAALLLSAADPCRESQGFGVARDYAASGEVEALLCLFEGREVSAAARQAALGAVAPGLREEVVSRLWQEADGPPSLPAAGVPPQVLLPLSGAPAAAGDARRLFRAVLGEEGGPLRPPSAAVGALLEVLGAGRPRTEASREALATLDPETVRVVLTAALLHLQDNGLDMTVHPDLLR